MNTYKPLNMYIPQEKINEISKDFNAKVNFLNEKYRDRIITNFINSIQNADMKGLYKQDVWRYKAEFVAQDISNIDNHKDYSNAILKEFFEGICKELKIELVNYQFSNVSEDGTRVFFIITIKNPL